MNQTLVQILSERLNDRAMIEELCSEFMPSGSGFDAGTKLDLDRSSDTKLIFQTAYHHMNDDGMYDGWTYHDVVVTASFYGFDTRVKGRDRNQIKEYIADMFRHALQQTLRYTRDGEVVTFVLEL